jgi:hypothetical protein
LRFGEVLGKKQVFDRLFAEANIFELASSFPAAENTRLVTGSYVPRDLTTSGTLDVVFEPLSDARCVEVVVAGEVGEFIGVHVETVRRDVSATDDADTFAFVVIGLGFEIGREVGRGVGVVLDHLGVELCDNVLVLVPAEDTGDAAWDAKVYPKYKEWKGYKWELAR